MISGRPIFFLTANTDNLENRVDSRYKADIKSFEWIKNYIVK